MSNNTHKTWREIAAPIISKVLADNKGEHEGKIARELFHAYPFGIRKHHPYKIWLDEIKVQRGLKKGKVCRENTDQKKLF